MIEGVLKEMKRIVESRIAAEMAKQDAAFGDGVVLEAPRTIQLGERAIPSEGFPAIAFFPTGASDFMYATARKDVTYSVQIGVVVQDTVEDVADKRLWRTVRAIENCLEIGTINGSDPIMSYKTTGIDFETGPYGVRNDNSLLKAGVISCAVRERLKAFDETQV